MGINIKKSLRVYQENIKNVNDMKEDNSGAICGVHLETQYCNYMNSMQINIFQ